MLITGFAAGVFSTNCYLVAPEPGGEAIIIDPGQDAAAQVAELVDQHEVRPVAVLLTHGHLDHTWTASQVCERYDIPAHIHPGDNAMLADPTVGIGPGLAAMMPTIDYTAPADVRELVDGTALDLAGLSIGVQHAPGHTQGSVLYSLQIPTDAGVVPICFSGDVLFAGSIGRTDLPGGDHAQLLETLATTVLPMADDTQVLPGHGQQTTIARERATNPFLTELTRSS
ncbi:MBL fold metallo-hydrolase [Williamsia sterculiae]|uniref:Glyoxylase, beta-lactamase superfamily II n=1 Tax=Williamsia sterculiae TaxID=1344003 RepID=A0A1N7EGU2_9NOCA|nr:MBL fold metallo-hydrolase [Williamsia sterculiae]SIR87372.1 Glyoxylase, beta-lactamase superfamily II [Williamsia sterculiae]